MSEQPQFEKKRTLTPAEVLDNVSEYGQLKLGNVTKGIPTNTQFVAEISGELEVQESPDGENKFYSFPVQYHCRGYDPEYVNFKVQVTGSKAEKLVAENPEYIGKNVLFGKGKLNGRAFHSLAVVANDQNREFVKPKPVAKQTPVATAQSQPEPDAFEMPEELKEWAQEAYDNPEAFLESYPDLSAFITYVMGSESDTDYFTKSEENKAKVSLVYNKIVRDIKGE